MNDPFLQQLQQTWQSTDIVHQDLIKKVKKRQFISKLEFIYNAAISMLCAVAGVYLMLKMDSGAMLFGVFLVGIGMPCSVYACKLVWQNLQWSDRDLAGTLAQLIKQHKNDLNHLRLLSRYLLSTPLLAVLLWILVLTGKTQLPIMFASGFSVGLLIGVGISVFRYRRLMKKRLASLNTLLDTQRQLEES